MPRCTFRLDWSPPTQALATAPSVAVPRAQSVTLLVDPQGQEADSVHLGGIGCCEAGLAHPGLAASQSMLTVHCPA